MEFSLLGPLEVSGGSVTIGSPKRRALLALLVLHHGKVVSTDRILDSLWGDHPPAGGEKTLHVHVSKLRSDLAAALADGDPQPLRTVPPGYVLDAADGEIDVARFRTGVAEARLRLGTDPVAAADALESALALVRGDPLADFAAEEFALPFIRLLEEEIVTAREDLLEARLRNGQAAAVLGQAETLVAEFPLRERLRGIQMRALYACGRQAEALRAYRAAEVVLAEELGITPGPGLRRLEEQILLHDPDLGHDSAGTLVPESKGNLPHQLTSFIGRAAELDELDELLDSHRLVTLAGPGGAGKTRLALEAAARRSSRDGAWIARLGQLHEDGNVAAAIRDALEVPGRAGAHDLSAVAAFVGGSRLLLVLDNCEHVLASAAHCAKVLLDSAPALTIITTSRQPLGIIGEAVYRVAPLRTPTVGASLAELRASDAGRLFIERAVLARPGFVLEPAEADHVVRICRTLDGIPLAIELAAARLGSLSVAEIAERLDDRFALLVSGDPTAEAHQATLEQTVRWSHDLLDAGEQLLFSRLGVFRGGWSLDAAEAVGAAASDERRAIAGTLARLVDKSLVVSESVPGTGATRFGMLESIRQFALARLDPEDPVFARHTEYYCDLASRARLGLSGPNEPTWLGVLDADSANLRVAVDRLLHAGATGSVLRIVASLRSYFLSRDRLVEPRRWIEAALDVQADASPVDMAGALITCGELATVAGDLRDAERFYLLAADVAGGPPGRRLLSEALGGLGKVALERGDLDEARVRLRRALELGQADGDEEAVAWALTRLAAAADPGEQQSLLDRSLVQHWTLGTEQGIGRVSLQQGWLALSRMELGPARSAFDTALEVWDSLGDRVAAAEARTGYGDTAFQDGMVDEASRHYTRVADAALALDSSHIGAVASERLAVVAFARGEVEQARTQLEKSLDLWRRIEPRPGSARTMGRLALVESALGRHDVARRWGAAGLTIWDRFKRDAGAAWSEWVLGIIELDAGDHDAARVQFAASVLRYVAAAEQPVVLDGWLSADAGCVAEALAAVESLVALDAAADAAQPLLEAVQGIRDAVASAAVPSSLAFRAVIGTAAELARSIRPQTARPGSR